MSDPWAPLPGFEPYERPQAGDFSQPDRKASDLRTFLRASIQAVRETEIIEAAVSWVRLPSGTTAQLTRKAADHWELSIPLGRDWFEVVEGVSREEVLRKAGAMQ